jgi:hypothetical protein
MTTIKLLSAGLIATVMLATPSMACKNYLAKRHIAKKADASASPPLATLTAMLAFQRRTSAHLIHRQTDKIAMSATTRFCADLLRGASRRCQRARTFPLTLPSQ